MWVFRNYGLPGHPTQSKLIVESGAKVVRGVTATTLPVTDNTLWTVVLRKVGAGPIRVLAAVRVPGDRKGSYYLDRERFEVGFQGQHVVRRDQSRVEAYYVEKGSKRLYEKR